jgi:hypothetical protein
MLLKETRKILKIKTGIKYFSSIFERVYVLEIHKADVKNSIANITLSSYDKSQTHKKILNTHQVLIDNKNISIEFLINSNFKFRPFISKLVLENDKSLSEQTSCSYKRKSIFKIFNTLKEHIDSIQMMEA